MNPNDYKYKGSDLDHSLFLIAEAINWEEPERAEIILQASHIIKEMRQTAEDNSVEKMNQLRDENQKLKEFIILQQKLTEALHSYLSTPEKNIDDFNALLALNNEVLKRKYELNLEI